MDCVVFVTQVARGYRILGLYHFLNLVARDSATSLICYSLTTRGVEARVYWISELIDESNKWRASDENPRARGITARRASRKPNPRSGWITLQKQIEKTAAHYLIL